VPPASPFPRRRLGPTAVEVTALGFGAAALGNLYRAIPDDAARACLAAALAGGIGYVDTAPHYGQGLSERRIGQASGAACLSSKVGRVLTPVAPPPPGTERHGFIDGDPFEPVFDYSYDGVMRSFESSRKRLNRERIDILLAHDLGVQTHGPDAPAHMKAFLDGGLRAMHDLRAAGLTGAIGLGVNEWQVCEEVMGDIALGADLDVILLAGRYTLLEQGALESFLPLCEARGVSVIVGGPFNSGILTGGDHYDYGRVPPGICDRVTRLKAVCTAHDVPLAAAALQFPLAHPAVACVIPGMADAAEVAANIALFAHHIPDALWDDLKSEGLLHDGAPTPQAHTPRTRVLS